VAIDRAAVLRNAEKLLRQGKLDAAIAEYRRVVEDQPRDWNTANILGDLYLRAAQSDRALEQFVRIADSLNADGFFSKAAALYKKILKIRPDDEHALMQAGVIAANQGMIVDARAYLTAAAKRRTARGDDEGVAEIRARLFDACLNAGDLERAREYATTEEHRKALGQALAGRSRRIHLLLTHLHLDHIQGLMFFAPLFDPEVEVTVWGPPAAGRSLRKRLARYISNPLSPIEIGAALVSHRGVTLGYRVSENGASLAYLPDHEPGLGQSLATSDPRWISGRTIARDASVLLHDGQYTDAEYTARRG